MQKGGLWERNEYKQGDIDQPLVTIVTVTFNAERHLAQALQSILNQTYYNIELIVIDGGSTDTTLDIITSFEDRIDYWQSEPDTGIYDAMNKGLSLARGRWIGFKNADDWYVGDAIETLIRSAQAVEADVFYGNSYSVIQEDPLQVSPFFTDHRSLGGNPGIDHRSSFVKTELHKRIKFNLGYRLAADFDVFWRLKKADAQFYHMERFIAYKRYGGASDGAEILKEGFQINRMNAGILFATYSRIRSLIQYYSWIIRNWLLLRILGTDRYHRFKGRKLK